MGAETEISVKDGIAQITLDVGPSARLTVRVMASLDAALSELAPNDTARVIVIRGKGQNFPSGVTDPLGGGDDQSNLLSDLCLHIENFPKPVITVLSGAVVGAGVEIALASHYRLCHRQARLGFPHVRLGLVPTAGATQRLPRLVGADQALELLLGGHLLPITSGKLGAFADVICDDPIDDAIVQFATTQLADRANPRPTSQVRAGFADAAAYQAAIKRLQQHVDKSPEVARKHILAAVEAAILLPIDAGLAFEQAAAEDCSQTDQSKALSHLFHAEQAVIAQTRRSDLPDIATLSVLGGSGIAVQIVLAALESDIGVNWLIKDPNQLRDSIGHVRTVLKDAVASGKLDSHKAKRRLEALRHGDGPEVIEGTDLVLRATRGQRGIHAPPNVPLAHCLPGTDPKLALHFAPPASKSQLIEVILGPQSTDKDRLAALSLARRMNRLAVVQTTSGAGLSDRLNQTLWRAADALVDLGQSPYVVDTALRRWGMAHPPFERADMVGLAEVAQHDRADGCQNWAALLARLDRHGTNSGRGYYIHTPSAPPHPDPEVMQLLNDQRAEQTALSEGLIVRLVVGAIANEGAKALRDGVVPRAGDIDVVSVFTHLVPNWHGGIMHAASEGGLLQTARAMEALIHPDHDLWTPDPVFADLIKYGRTFDDL